MIIGYIMIFLHWFLDELNYIQSVINGRQFQFETNHMFWPFTDKFILMGYPYFTAGYYLLSIRKLREQGSPRNMYILPVGLLLSSPLIFDVVHDYVYGHGFFLQNPDLQRYLLLPAVFIIFWDVIIVKPPKPKEVLSVEDEVEESIQYPEILKVQNESLAFYIEELCEASGEHLSSDLQTKQGFVKQSPFGKEDWEKFFAETHTSWNFLKKFVRIKRAIALMEEGFLVEGSIEELAQEVGYSTRASLYLAFRQVMGVPFPEYREEHEM
jgi:AraC-like DNA-binding protein